MKLRGSASIYISILNNNNAHILNTFELDQCKLISCDVNLEMLKFTNVLKIILPILVASWQYMWFL